MAYDLSTVDWFEWNGIKCTDYGMHVLTQPQLTRARERVEQIIVPGRAGALTFVEGDDIYDQITLVAGCVVDSPDTLVPTQYGVTDRVDAICGWLRGQGEVRFANRTEGYYKGRVVNQIPFDKIMRGNPHLGFQVQFTCDPFCYLTSGLTPLVFAASPGTLTNRGNIPAMPLIRVTGSGSGTIMCGDSSMIINDFSVVSYIMLDCDAKVCYTGQSGNPLDPMRLLGTRVTGEWLTIPRGTSFLTYTGGISSVTVIPRWRNL